MELRDETALAAKILPRLVRRLVAHAPIACSPEALIYAETCASTAVVATVEALHAAAPDEMLARLRAAELATLALRAHILQLRDEGVAPDAVFEAMMAATSRLAARLRGHMADARFRRSIAA